MMLQGLRIALVGPLPPPAAGMANQTRQLAELLHAEGADIRVVQVNPPYRPAWIGRFRGLREVFRFFPYLRRLWRATGEADLVHVMANSGWAWHLVAAPAIWIASWRRVPVVVNYRGGAAERFLATASRWIRPTLRRAAVLAVPSGYLNDVFAQHGIASVIVPNVVDLGSFAPVARPHGGAPHLIVARNLDPIYDVATAIRAFARVRDRFRSARLSIAGSGPERERLQALALSLSLGDAVVFTGRLERAAMAGLYRSADVMVNPSRIDNMPNSVLEALASGVPVVSTNVGGVPYLVRDGETALLVQPGDDAAMAGAILRVLEQPELARRLVRAGLADVQQYAWPRVRDTLLGVYDDALRRTPTRLPVAE